MFWKLLKYEWRASRKVLGIFTVSFLGLGGLSCLLAWLLRRSALLLTANPEAGPAVVVPAVVAAVCLYLFFFACLLYPSVLQTVLVVRFYLSRFTARGYLAFTLPASLKQHYWAELLHLLLWGLVASVQVVTAAWAVGAVGFYNTDLLPRIAEAFTQVFRSTLGTFPVSPLFLVCCGLVLLSAFVYNTVRVLFCVVAGACLVPRLKLLMAFALDYGITMVVSTMSGIGSFLSGWIAGARYGAVSGVLYGNLWSMTLGILVHIAVVFVCCRLSMRLLERKLNLP